MKQYVVSASEMKRYDANTIEKYRIPSLLLMERAALVTVEELERARGTKPCRVLVLAGCGNNGGDGLAVGRLLMLQGYEVTCVLLGSEEKCTEETARQIAILREYGGRIFSTMQESEYDIVSAEEKQATRSGIFFSAVQAACLNILTGKQTAKQDEERRMRGFASNYDIVIDAIFGVGLSRSVEGSYRDAIEWIDQSEAYVCSVDIPSGVNADTGAVMGCAVRADLTVTYGFRKLGHLLYPGAEYAGMLVCRQMGIDEHSFLGEEPFWYTHIGRDSALLPGRRPDGNKGTFGKALLIVGSSRIAGAAMMAVKSSFRIGTGMVKAVTAEENKEALQQYVPEAMMLTYPEDIFSDSGGSPEVQEKLMKELRAAESWADCVLIGCGIGMGRQAQVLLRFSISESNLPLVIDADGLNLLARDRGLQEAMAECGERGRIIILTPHLGEFARLYGCTTAEAKEHLTVYPRELSERLRCIVVCKDARTVVAWHNGKHGYVNTTGNAGMATAGSGDVLAGMITGLVAQGMTGVDAAVAGVYLHGMAGDLAAQRETEVSMTATDIIDRIRDVVLLQREEMKQGEVGK